MTKTVLITGASSGFGQASAEKFAKAYAGTDARLILVARRMDKLEALKKQLETCCAVDIAAVDMASQQSLQQFIQGIENKAIDILINNAGKALGLEPAYATDLDDWEDMVDTNIKGLIRITRYILPTMVARNAGHIINIGSIAGSWPYPGGNVYGASKAFVQQFSRGLRADLLGKNIRVTNIDPGLAETNFSNVRFKNDNASASKVYENTQPLLAGDIADIIYWVSTVPGHININTLEVMPVCQAWGALSVDRSMM